MMTTKRIAFLATGDEIVNGDILNTNGPTMAHRVFNEGIATGMHIMVSDRQQDIEQTIHYLLKHHEALIITGGLGPTSDDRTRFALANALNKELEFDETAWKTIEARFAHYNLKNQPLSNKNQALFPKGATVIPNPDGSAAGCWLTTDKDQLIFMLPGPPKECLPMFQEVVKPLLVKHQFNRPIIYKRWLLFNVNEGEIAEQLDQLAEPYSITTGYRADYPYVEFKVYSEDNHAIDQFLHDAKGLIESNLINPHALPASRLLAQFLENFEQTISIDDQATKGHFIKAITNFKTYQKVLPNKTDNLEILHFEITGLPELWEGKESGGTSWLQIKTATDKKRFEIPYRAQRTINYAVEFLANELLKLLSNK